MPTPLETTRDGERPVIPGLAGRRFLIVEYEPIVALDLQVTLIDAGCIVVGPCSTADSARQLIDAARIDGALIGMTPGFEVPASGVDLCVADTLAAQGIAFVLFSGRPIGRAPERHRHRPLIAKPFVRADLLAALERAMNPRPPLHLV